MWASQTRYYSVASVGSLVLIIPLSPKLVLSSHKWK